MTVYATCGSSRVREVFGKEDKFLQIGHVAFSVSIYVIQLFLWINLRLHILIRQMIVRYSIVVVLSWIKGSWKENAIRWRAQDGFGKTYPIILNWRLVTDQYLFCFLWRVSCTMEEWNGVPILVILLVILYLSHRILYFLSFPIQNEV